MPSSSAANSRPRGDPAQRRRCSGSSSRTSSSTRSTARCSSSRTSTAAIERPGRDATRTSRNFADRAGNFNSAAAATGACAERGRRLRRQLAGRRARTSVRADARSARSTPASPTPTPNIATISSARDDGTPLNQALRRLARPAAVQRAEDRRDRRARLDPADRRSAGCRACSTSMRRLQRRATTPAPTCSRRRARILHGRQRRASASAGPTIAGRSSCGRRTCSTRTISRSRSTRRSRKARSDAAVHRSRSYPGGRQIFSTFLAEPRTYGLTLRGTVRAPAAARGRAAAAAPAAAAAAAPATQTCPDGSVILATDACPAPPPPPPPPPPAARARLIGSQTKRARRNGGPFSYAARGLEVSRAASSNAARSCSTSSASSFRPSARVR